MLARAVGDLHRRRLAALGIEPATACAVREDPDYAGAAERAHAEGRREQRCPDCNTAESGGGVCSWCFHPGHPDQWIAKPLSDAQRVARTGGRAAPVSVAPRKAPRTPCASPETPPEPPTEPPALWPAP